MQGEREEADKPNSQVSGEVIAWGAHIQHWELERQKPEYQEVSGAAKELYQKLRNQRTAPATRATPFVATTYDAAHNLMGAVTYLLEEPYLVNRVGPSLHKEGEEQGTANLARVQFVDKIFCALNHLGLSGDTVEEALKRAGEI